MNLPEPKGVHPLVERKRVKMESIMVNYKKDSEIEGELENVNIENYLRFDFNGKYNFKKCAFCNGPLLGHYQPKCSKLEYDAHGVERYEVYLQNIGGFDEAIDRRHERFWQKESRCKRSEEGTVTLEQQEEQLS